jgi:hypothetical protein
MIMGTSKQYFSISGAGLTVPLIENPSFSRDPYDKERLRYHEFAEKTSFLNFFHLLPFFRQRIIAPASDRAACGSR